VEAEAAAAAPADGGLLNTPTIIILAVCIAAVLWAIITYNLFVVLRNRCRNGRTQIDIQLKRRYDLVTKLVQVVKEYASHEERTLQRVTEARTRAISAGTVAEQADAENNLSGSLKSLFAVSEGYPELKANQTYLKLHDELVETEDSIRFSRQFYNDTVMRYNTAIETFPNAMLANLFRFEEEPFFDLDDS
jgi:LemA protein